MTIKKFTLFIGLCDKDTKQQEVTTLNAYKILNNILDDCTITEGKGIYTHDDGTKVVENTLIVSVFDFNNTFNKVSVCETIKQVLNQESIACVTENIDSELI